MTDHILVIHKTRAQANPVTDALKQMYPKEAHKFKPTAIYGCLTGIGIQYAVWFCELPDNDEAREWKECTVNTRFGPEGIENLTPAMFAELI